MEHGDPLARHNVRIRGQGTAPRTIVFVHGFGTDQSVWLPVAAAFERDFRVVLIDNAGAGGADPAAFAQHRYLSLRAYAHDLVEIAEALDLVNAVLVGHSVGGMIAALAAIEAPGRFERLALLGVSPRYLDEPGYHGGFSDEDLAQLYRAVEENYADWADQFAPLMMANDDRPELARSFAASLKSIPAPHALTVLCAIFQSDHRAELATIRQPTLLIQSRRDAAVPPSVAAYLERAIPRAALIVLETEGHLPHVAAPAQVAAVLRPFATAAAGLELAAGRGVAHPGSAP